MKFDRRQALGLLGAGAALPAAAEAKAPAADAPIPFRHGVASGDPHADGVVIWTRVTMQDDKTVPVTWSVAEDIEFTRVARRGRARATAARDGTVKVEVRGLKPGREYFYMFEAGGFPSRIGRTRTLPEGPTPDAVIAFATCALWVGGNFNAYHAIARLPRVDAVVHLGDYIYEFGAGGYGSEIGDKIGRVPDPPHECLTLADYRRRHAQAKSDLQLQAAHLRAPWIVVWDDHETANDSWTGGAENHQPETEGGWSERKAAAIQAWYEWMPIRDPKPGAAFDAINRSFQFGDLASLIMLETRLGSRSYPLDYAKDLPIVDGRPDLAAFGARLNDPSRTLMGDKQEAWVASELTASVASGRRWQVLGNQVVMARVIMPDIRKGMGEEKFGAMFAQLPDYAKQPVMQALGIAQLGLPSSLDSWDGYPVARERFYAMLKATAATPIVVSGDSHAFWANNLSDAGGERVAVEFGATGISSPGYNDFMPGVPFGDIIPSVNKEVVYTDHAAKGFVLLTLTRETAKAELMAVSTVYAPQYEVAPLRTFEVRPAERGVGPIVAL